MAPLARHRSCTPRGAMIRRLVLLAGVVFGLALSSAAGAIAEQWVLWSRDTQFRAGQPARLWRTTPWAFRGGPFDTREQCQRLMDDHLQSAPRLLGDGYRVTSVV